MTIRRIALRYSPPALALEFEGQKKSEYHQINLDLFSHCESAEALANALREEETVFLAPLPPKMVPPNNICCFRL